MALVAYENSDSSEFEDDAEENNIPVKQLKREDDSATKPDSAVPESSTNLFNQLPKPVKDTNSVIEEDDEFLHKKDPQPDIVKPKTRITIPLLSDFKDVQNTVPTSKTKCMGEKKSGLLGILPQPKNKFTSTTKSLIPNVVSQNTKTNNINKKQLPSPVKLKTEAKSCLVNEYSDESDNDEDVQNDFFSIHKCVELPPDAPLDIDVKPVERPSTKEPRSLESYFKKETHVELQPDIDLDNPMNYVDDTIPEPIQSIENNTNEILNEEAILKLTGARGKRKREDIQIVDINQQEILDEARAMLMEGLMKDTSKIQSSSRKTGNGPTSQQKRKHQITYLAHQAKANEQELQNQWANNRMSRRQTQSKYGF
ncbi:Proline-rich protein PRCC [Danaus plexippus plexippus]|uniref:Proline-rich protein PRCC n=1 Tax=Danaus plexippus plexippus TaxID=278856 RepID=A0A212FIR1_DANPL|nr:Proline-rich protein PRCC [Danaus plexippus plexippus]